MYKNKVKKGGAGSLDEYKRNNKNLQQKERNIGFPGDPLAGSGLWKRGTEKANNWNRGLKGVGDQRKVLPIDSKPVGGLVRRQRRPSPIALYWLREIKLVGCS